jgi:O-antigen/teichoic acid export membrane protein
VKHSVRRTLLYLGTGVVLQRLCQLAGFVLIGRALGVERLGIYAQGQAMAAVLTVLAGAGVSNLTARMLAARPEAARALISAAVRRRVLVGGTLALLVAAVTAIGSVRPWFWLLCALHTVPAAFDLKQMLDASGRTRREVRLETGTAALQLLGVAGWLWLGGTRLETLAALTLCCRALYAACAWQAIRELPVVAAVVQPKVWQARVALGQIAHELMTIGDVWLVAIALGDRAAGLYALAVRFAAAALLPSAQLARLLLPHLLHAGADGDPARTLGTALRTTLLVTLPMLAGGTCAAMPLCAIGGEHFATAAPALALLLLAGCLQHVGWQCSNALLAMHRDRAYAHGFGWPALLQLALFLCASAVAPPAADTAAALAAAAAAIAQLVYAGTGLWLVRPLWRDHPALWPQPLRLAALTGGGAVLPLLLASEPWLLPLQLLGGGAGFAIGLWCLELRGRWRRLGDGLAAASGFGA